MKWPRSAKDFKRPAEKSDRDLPNRAEHKSKDFAIEGWSLLSIDIGDSGDVDSSSLGESAFFLSKCGVLLLKEEKIRESPGPSIV